jgi:hypothetical protein
MKTVSEIVRIKEGIEAELLKRPGVTGVDVGYKYVAGKRTDEIAIRVLVEKKKKDIAKAERVPEAFEGVTTDVIERKYELQSAQNRKKVEDAQLQLDAGRYRPLEGGMGMGPCRVVGGYVYVGTLGAIVKDNATANPLCLSNFHVMCIDNGWHVGDQMCQPGRVDGGNCPADVVGTLQRAVSNLSTGIGYVCDVLDIGHVGGTATAVLNSPVRKRGRTTGLTYGFVDSVSASVNIDYGDGIGVKTLTNQVGVRPDTAHNPLFSDHGDSGSVIMDNNLKVVSLLFAGSSDGHTLGNPIADVLSALNISMCVGGKALVKELKVEVKEHKIETKELKAEVKELKDAKNESKDTKDHKTEAKDAKDHKVETKEKIESKDLKDHKVEVKEHKVEKSEIDIGPKVIGDNPKISDVPPFNPPINPVGQGLEARVAQLEASIGQITTFITEAMRPDLSTGALKQEPDLSALSRQLQQQAVDAAQAKASSDCGCGH